MFGFIYNIYLLFIIFPVIYYIGYLRGIKLVNALHNRDYANQKWQQAISHAYEHGLFLAIIVTVSTFLLSIILYFYMQHYISTLIHETVVAISAQELDFHIYHTITQQIYAYIQYGTSHNIDNMHTEIEVIKSRIIQNYILFNIVFLSIIATIFYFTYNKITLTFPSRKYLEKFLIAIMFLCATFAILTTFGIVLSLIFETIQFFNKISIIDYLFGTQWSPQLAIREDQVGSSGAFGIIPLLTGTLLITVIAILIAGPIGLLSAIYLTEFSSKKLRNYIKPLLEILAGIPTVVYGFFAVVTFAPFMRDLGYEFNFVISTESALVAGITMGIMIIPFVSSLSDDIMHAVPQSLRDGSYALGSTRTENILKVVIPAALPGIASAFLLAISRAIGETMIVVMAAGMAANLTLNPFEAVTTITVQMTSLLVGDQEFDSSKTLAAFALGFTLFVVTLLLNFIALRIVKKYREIYS